jgi:hypothetical protein|nr:MAG TPA: hypothetical protein [Caudoviricetes sp.]
MIKLEIKSKETKQTVASKEFNGKSEIGPWLKQYVHLQTVYILLTSDSGITTELTALDKEGRSDGRII